MALGDLRPATGASKDELKGKIVVAPPGALNDRWSRRLPDPITAMASGWMRVRQRARQRNVELPLIVSDHADWDELTDDHPGARAPRGLDHPRPGGCAEALVHDPPDQGAGAATWSAARTRTIEASPPWKGGAGGESAEGRAKLEAESLAPLAYATPGPSLAREG